MARNFTPGDSVLVTGSPAPGAGNVNTVAGWVRSEDVTRLAIAFSIDDNAVAYANYLIVGHDSSGVMFYDVHDGVALSGMTGSTIIADTWYHVAMVCRSGSDREGYLDGVTDATSTVTRDMDLIDQNEAGVGGPPPSATIEWDGDIDEFAIWDVDLAVWEIEALAAGANPLTVRPGNLVASVPLRGDSPEFDNVRAGTWTVSGATHVPIGAPIILTQRPSVAVPAVVPDVAPFPFVSPVRVIAPLLRM